MGSIARYYSSTAVKTTLTVSISSSDTSLQVAATGGFPSSYPYTLVLEKDSANEEIVTVTALVGTSFTITRGVDGTSGRSHAAGVSVEHAMIAKDLTDFRAHEAAAANVHDIGAGASVVGTTTSQTISNKTLGSNLAAGGYRVTGLADPSSAQDAATKNWSETSMTSQLSQATTQATNAAASATAAAASATAAAASASTASTQASNASTSASSASTSASTATTQASAASTSATNAASSASAASASAATASTQASNASSSATTASTQASNASTSASSASTSASNASTSATNAATSATNAASSATAAAASAASVVGLPSQTGNSGKYLTTDGSAASWSTVNSLPTQTSNAGKYLTTDGTTASWSAITTDPTPTVFLLMGA